MRPNLPSTGLRQLAITLAAFLLIAVEPLVADEEATLAVESAEAALQRALDMCGFVRSEPYREHAAASISQVMELKDSTTPFLGEYASGRTVWRVSLQDSRPQVDSGFLFEWVTDVEIYIDSAEGHILKIVCNNAPLDPELDLELLASDAEEQLLNAREEYVGFPAQSPVSTFAEAALACPQKPTLARQVIGQYVLLKFADRPIRPVWVIQMRGIPPIVFFGDTGDDMPVYLRNRVRQVVDGITGRVFFSTTRPSIHLDSEERQSDLD